MTDAVKRRAYDSSRRQDQARETRRGVLAAARRLFLERGYAATNMSTIATEAGVSVETVYKAFRNKPGLVKAVFDVAIAGDDEPVPMVERDMVQRINDEPDPAGKLRIYADHIASSSPRHVPVQLLVRDAAASDAGAAEVWDQLLAERLTGMTLFAAHLQESGSLRTGVSRDDAADLLWAYNSPELWDLLVLRRGWSAERFGDWVAAALGDALLARDS